MSDLYIIYVYFGAEVNHTNLKNAEGRKTQSGES